MSDQSPFGGLTGPVLVSACLLGIPCRYDGTSRAIDLSLSLDRIIPVPVCPEQLGGLATPRSAAFLVGGDGMDVLQKQARVVTHAGDDLTAAFLRGAQYVAAIARRLDIRWAILKERSPSCGSQWVWIGENLRPGCGVTSAWLRGMGITVVNEAGEA